MTETQRFDDRVDTAPMLGFAGTCRLLGRSLAFLGKHRQLFCWKLLFALVGLLPALAFPWIYKIVVDQVILQQPFNTEQVPFPPFVMPLVNAVAGLSPAQIMLAVSAVYVVLLVFFGMRAEEQTADPPKGFDAATQAEQEMSKGASKTSGLWGLLEVLLTVRLSQRLANGLRTSLMGRLTRLPMTTLDDQRIGDSVYRVMYDAPMLPGICYKLTVDPVLSLTAGALSVYLMQYSYGGAAPELVWLAAALVPLTLLLTSPLSGLVRRVNQESRAAGAATTNAMEESIDNIGAVQPLGGMQKEAQRFQAKSAESFRRHRRTVLLDNLLLFISYASIVLALVYAFVLITDKVIAGVLTPGDYAVLAGIFVTLGLTARYLGLYWIEMQKNVAAVRRVFFFIDYTSEAGPAAAPLAPIQRGVQLEGVSFAYPDGRQALSDVSLELPLGELVAIVGPTGAGKTTLAYLIPAYLRPTAGRVRFDSQDLADVSPAAVREQVTYVFQEHMLLSDTIRENLLLANPDATDAELREACRLAGALEFIEQLPAGLDTAVGKAGDTLSVGQKQRLSIARGLVRATPVLVLDEPTAALDPQTENALVAALRGFAQGRLVVIIAHRLSTIREADRIVFLEEGRVRDIGSHAALMANPSSPYRRFVELQSL